MCQKIEILQSILDDYNIKAKVNNYISGSTVDLYEVKLYRGVRISTLVAIKEELSMWMGSKSMRIFTIPSKRCVGIEVEAENKEKVSFKQLIESPQFNSDKLRAAIGKNLVGEDVFIDIDEMPHLLIAGATGAGKSVLLNSIICSLILAHSKEDLELMLIDPKMVELAQYEDIGHLRNNKIINNVEDAFAALQDLSYEMKMRYEKMALAHKRNIDEYNEALGGPIGRMKKIVVVVDEFADIVMSDNSKAFQEVICKIAQLGRAAGIHLIIATQRPSVQIITGVIKANLPSRIALAVGSAVDSRVILDETGAEDLIGKGDMLIKIAGSNEAIRAQGTYLNTEEIERIIRGVK